MNSIYYAYRLLSRRTLPPARYWCFSSFYKIHTRLALQLVSTMRLLQLTLAATLLISSKALPM